MAKSRFCFILRFTVCCTGSNLPLKSHLAAAGYTKLVLRAESSGTIWIVCSLRLSKAEALCRRTLFRRSNELLKTGRGVMLENASSIQSCLLPLFTSNDGLLLQIGLL